MNKRAALVAAGLIFLAPVAGGAARFAEAGMAGSESFELALDSIEEDGGRLVYWNRSYTTGYYATHRMTRAAVDCTERTRADLDTISIDRSGSLEGPAASPVMRKVYEGTRQAEELDLVCRFAATEQLPEGVRMVEAPRAPVQPLLGSGRVVATGLVASRDGLVVTAHEAVKGCASLSVRRPSGTHAAALLHDEPMAYLAVLKIDGYFDDVLLPARQLALTRASTLVGFGTGARAETAAVRLPLKPVPAGGAAGDSALLQRLSPPLPLSMGWVLDGDDAVLGVAIFDVRDDPQAPRAEVVPSIAVNRILWYHGHDWSPPDEAPRPGTPVRTAQAALVQVACHDP